MHISEAFWWLLCVAPHSWGILLVMSLPGFVSVIDGVRAASCWLARRRGKFWTSNSLSPFAVGQSHCHANGLLFLACISGWLQRICRRFWLGCAVALKLVCCVDTACVDDTRCYGAGFVDDVPATAMGHPQPVYLLVWAAPLWRYLVLFEYLVATANHSNATIGMAIV